jgi:hypothetical protein
LSFIYIQVGFWILSELQFNLFAFLDLVGNDLIKLDLQDAQAFYNNYLNYFFINLNHYQNICFWCLIFQWICSGCFWCFRTKIYPVASEIGSRLVFYIYLGERYEQVHRCSLGHHKLHDLGVFGWNISGSSHVCFFSDFPMILVWYGLFISIACFVCAVYLFHMIAGCLAISCPFCWSVWAHHPLDRTMPYVWAHHSCLFMLFH